MSKGWGQRPSAVDRKAYDASWEATFSTKGAVVEENGDAPPAGDKGFGERGVELCREIGEEAYRVATAPDSTQTTPRKRIAPDGCEIASVFTQGFNDQYGEA